MVFGILNAEKFFKIFLLYDVLDGK